MSPGEPSPVSIPMVDVVVDEVEVLVVDVLDVLVVVVPRSTSSTRRKGGLALSRDAYAALSSLLLVMATL